MSALRDFRIWFDGWVENIEQCPTQKQWERLRDRILALDTTAQPEPQQAVIAPVAPHTPAPTKATWITRFKATLIDRGYDPESANEMMPKLDSIDPDSDPIAAANRAHQGMSH